MTKTSQNVVDCVYEGVEVSLVGLDSREIGECATIVRMHDSLLIEPLMVDFDNFIIEAISLCSR